ncbi:MAG: OadG family protein [Kiritimatiellae bacterium]|nr:OadG family protein [Kiritimatiellia bacterium]
MDVILQGLVLMGFGMGFVFAFLAFLIVVTKVSMGFVAKFDSILPQDAPKKKPVAAAAGNEDADIALAIAVALG